MAEGGDSEDKTEEPTGRRLSEATEKGNIPRSQEVNHWFMLAGLTFTIAMLLGSVGSKLVGTLTPYLERPDQISVTLGSATSLLAGLSSGVAVILFPPLLVAVLMALIGSFLQHPPVISGEKLKPQFSKISPMTGLKRIFSAVGMVDFTKGVLKVIVVGAVAAMIVWPDLPHFGNLVALEPIGGLAVAQREILKVLIGVLIVLALIATADVLFQRFEHHRKLKMSLQEVKDETKQTEGDPQIKARIRQIRMQRVRKRMMAAVPGATVVITNPTHYAVALKYDGDSMDAPVVVAKGVDHLALRIRSLAIDSGVPIVENPPLARALYATADVDREVPVEHYKAVAEVIGYVMRLRRGHASN